MAACEPRSSSLAKSRSSNRAMGITSSRPAMSPLEFSFSSTAESTKRFRCPPGWEEIPARCSRTTSESRKTKWIGYRAKHPAFRDGAVSGLFPRLLVQEMLRHATILNGVGIVGIQAEGLIEVSQRVLIIALQQIGIAARVVGSRQIGLKPNRFG